MPSYKTAFGSFLKTEDLQGRAIRAVIETVGIEEVKGDDGIEKKLVARFVGKDKALILNRTNCDTLATIAGTDDYDHWIGLTVVLFPTTTQFGAKMVPCLRIRAPQAAAPAPLPVAPPPPAPEAWTRAPLTAVAAAVATNGDITDDDIPF